METAVEPIAWVGSTANDPETSDKRRENSAFLPYKHIIILTSNHYSKCIVQVVYNRILYNEKHIKRVSNTTFDQDMVKISI